MGETCSGSAGFQPALRASRPYFPALDGLRGVAALAVLGSHFENLSGVSLHLQHSGVAVDFFFILSGFVIAQAYEARLAEGLPWRAYMLLRLRRLYPAILGGLLLGLGVALGRGEILFPAMGLAFLLLPTLWGPVVHGGEAFPLDGPEWSLFLELAANAVHAALLPWLTTRRLVIVVGLSAAALVAVSLHFGGLDVGWARQNLWGGPPRVIFGFGAGILIFRLRERGVAAPRTPLALIVAGLLLCLFQPGPEHGLHAWTDAVIVVAVLPALVCLAASSPVTGAPLRISAWLGGLSYPLYAAHAPLLRAFEGVLATLEGDQALVGWALALPVVVGLAVLFERSFDAPIRRRLARASPLTG